MTWKISKKAFLDKFFLREKWEAKVVEFINFFHGVISVLEYYLKSTKFSKYSHSLVFNVRDE